MNRVMALVLTTSLLSAPAYAQVGTDSTVLGGLPVGRGSLNQETITLRLRTTNLEIRFVPLDERVLRLLADDSYQSLRRLLEGSRVRLDSIAQRNGVKNPGLAIVSFHALAPNARFDPQLVTLSTQGQPNRAVASIPMSAAFSNQQLDVGNSASGLFLFSRPIPVAEPFTVTYLDARSEDWEKRLPRLDAERARILGRSQTRPDSGRD